MDADKEKIDNRKYISAEEQKRILLDLLIEVDSFCKEHEIKYYLLSGTLLGAVRHAGFIPWDDDIDICMFREDYEKFLKEYSNSSNKYKLLSLELDKDYYYPFAKLVNMETVLIESKKDQGLLGLYLDIFPIDNCPGETLEEACRNVDKMDFLRWLRNFKIIEFSRSRKISKNTMLFVGKLLTLPVSRRKIAQMISNKASKNRNVKCQFVGELVNTAYGHGEVYDRCHFGSGISIDFEGHTFIAPKNYDAILKSMYGDYMKLPPIEKRVSNHNSICWYR